MTSEPCPICGENTARGFPVPNDRAGFDCNVCGYFLITGTALVQLRAGAYKDERYKLSGVIRSRSSPDHRLKLQSDNIAELIATAPVPTTPLEAVDRLVLLVHQYLPSLVDRVIIYANDYPLIFARSRAELRGLIKVAEEVGYLTYSLEAPDAVEKWNCGLTVEGWRRLAELRRTGQLSDQAFVAMWFNDEVEAAWTEGFYPALHDAGYRPIRIDRVEHNDKIDDVIVVEIRRSGLVVADFTGNRGGVYFEAGFAKGLGLPVVWTVREDQINDVHFDTRQFNHITWKTPAELREKLYNRVVATLGVAPKAGRAAT